MHLLGNIIWIVFGGFLTAIEYILAGVALCLTIIGIPWGIQCFKLAVFVLMPFGLKAQKRESGGGSGCINMIANIIWFFIGAIPLVITHFILGVLFALTIIGLPFAKQHFKLMSMSLTPFGRDVISA